MTFGIISPDTLSQLKEYEFVGGWEDENDVFLWHRVNGERKIIHVPDVSRYFCIRRSDFEKIPKSQWAIWKASEFYDKGIVKGDYAYVYSKFIGYKNVWNTWLTQLDDLGAKPLEGDVTRLQRLMIDNQLRVAGVSKSNSPRTAFFDIETDDRGDKIDIGNDRVLSVAWKDGQTGQEYFLVNESDTDESEKEFLLKVYAALIQYDILIGYNNYQFDDMVLRGRFDYLSINTDKWRRVETLDFFNTLERQGTFSKYEVRNKRLDTIAKAVLGRGKVEHDETIYELWSTNRAKLEEYNMEDVRLIYEMEQILQTTNLIISVCSYAGLLHSLNYSPAKTVDTFLLRAAARRRQTGNFDFRYATGYYRPEHNLNRGSPFTRNALPSDKRKGRKEILEEQYGIEYEPVEGALVMEATPGLYKNVHAFDFQSLYPNTIRAFNIGHDTLLPENSSFQYKNTAPNGSSYRTDFVSNMSESVSFLIDERKRIRAQIPLESNKNIKTALDIQQKAVKELTNSFYGVCAQYGGRYYSKSIAESITSSGRTFLPFGDEYMAALGHRVVIGDTDSLYISISDNTDPNKLVDNYLQLLYAHLKEKYNVYKPEYLKMSYEKRMDSVLIVAKKLYSAWVTMEDGKEIPEGKLVTKGLSLLKGNYPKWATEICKEILVDLLSGRFTTSDHFKRIVLREKDKLANGEIPYQMLLKSARIGKSLDDYVNEKALVHVRIARRLAEQGQLVGAYTTISYLITNGDTLRGGTLDGVDESEINENTEYDAVYYFNEVLMPSLESILSPVFPEVEWETLRFPKNYKRAPFSLRVKVKK